MEYFTTVVFEFKSWFDGAQPDALGRPALLCFQMAIFHNKWLDFSIKNNTSPAIQLVRSELVNLHCGVAKGLAHGNNIPASEL